MDLYADAKTLEEVVIGHTESVCPVCLRKLPAERVREGKNIFLCKNCPDHGRFKTIIWRGEPDFDTWYQEIASDHPSKNITEIEKGCPYDCGLCPEHRQQSCCVLLEVTQRCNLKCPICFADSGSQIQKDPDLQEVKAQLEVLMDTAGNCNLQLSGGEPTVSDDLPEIIAIARTLGFSYIQLNTNGIRLAEDPDYVKTLKDAGLSTVFLQFDGTKDEIYRALRGRNLLQIKKTAIANCARHHLGVVLVPTIVPGINSDNIGEIIRFALKGLPIIRGVNFQPISYFGRYPQLPADKDRITLPEIMQAIEEQTNGLMPKANFAPSGGKHSLCSFHCDYSLMEDGTLTPLSQKQSSCCCKQGEDSITKARNYIATRWQLRDNQESRECCGSEQSQDPYASWDRLIERIQNYRLSITCIAFQDADNLDLERLKNCSLHFVANGKIVPFCAYNLTNREGLSLYR